MEKFDQSDVYANHVRVYRQTGRVCELSLDTPMLGKTVAQLKMSLEIVEYVHKI